MPRKHRPQFAGAVYHVGARGNNRRTIYTCDEDRELFLLFLGRIVWRLGWRLHAYCLMGNHYHLLVQTMNANIAEGMQYLNGAYARVFNGRHRRKDHLFGRRYWHELVETDAHLVWLTRYIVRNPVRAGICPAAGDWPWSSFRATVGDVERPTFLAVAWVLAQFGDDRETAQARYRRYVSTE
jgi:REP element-mobilizing transposase RayT